MKLTSTEDRRTNRMPIVFKKKIYDEDNIRHICDERLKEIIADIVC